MDRKTVTIAIPASIISDTPHLREKTSKIGLIARAAAIFRVNEIIVYSDNTKTNQRKDLNLIALLLNYLETPQYLRKSLFKLEPDLQYAGILPPLRTPNHPLSGKTKHLQVGEYREGIVLSECKDGLMVDIGVQKPALLRQSQSDVGERLTMQVVKVGDSIEVQTVNRDDVPVYWGYKVRLESSFGKLVKNTGFDLKIATAKVGDNFNKAKGQLEKVWLCSSNILLAFGAPSHGLHEIIEQEGLKLNHCVDFVLNTISNQGTATVRTEEALLATLALINLNFNY